MCFFTQQNTIFRHPFAPSYLDKGVQPYYIHNTDETTEPFELRGGEIFVTRPYEKHSTGEFSQLRGTMYWIHVDTECKNLLGQTSENQAILRSSLDSLDKHIIPAPHSVSSRLTEAFTLLCVPDTKRIFRSCQLLSLFITELSEQNQKINRATSSISPKIIEALSIIDAHITSPELSIQSISDQLHYSKAYVMTQFRREMGVTLHEYILNKRIELSKELLKKRTITETAFLLCFSSSQHFSRAFKDRMNMTPREYVISYRNSLSS